MMPEFIIELNLGLNLRRKIFEIIVQTDDMSGVEVVRQSGIGVKSLIPVDRLKVFERPVRNEILGHYIPGAALNPWGMRPSAGIKARSIGRSPYSRRIRTVMALPKLSLHHKPGDKLGVVTNINSIPVKGAFPASVDQGPCVVGFPLDSREADKRHIVAKQSDTRVHRFRRIGPSDPGCVTDDAV